MNRTTEGDLDVVLARCDRAAVEAVATMRGALAGAGSAAAIALLTDADAMLGLLEQAELRAELARSTTDEDCALEYAESAMILATSARDEARRRVRRLNASAARLAPRAVSTESSRVTEP